MPDAVVKDVEVGLIATSTGTCALERVLASSDSAADVVVVAVLLIAQ